jgi:DNA-binding MarR family transcriptional regulator
MSNELDSTINALTVFSEETGGVSVFTHSLLILLYIAKSHPKGITATELEELLGVSTSTVWRNIKILSTGREESSKALGLVLTIADPTERRRNLLKLTKKGEKLVQRLEERLSII